MIESWHVREALRSRFGSALVDVPGIWNRAAGLLQGYAPYRDTFSDLAVRLEDVLLNTVYEQLGPSMGVQMDDGSVRRIRSAEMKEAADIKVAYCEFTFSFDVPAGTSPTELAKKYALQNCKNDVNSNSKHKIKDLGVANIGRTFIVFLNYGG